MRYTDEVRAAYTEIRKSSGMTDGASQGETLELCKWTVDIGSLPSFQENASTPTADGFYTGMLNPCPSRSK